MLALHLVSVQFFPATSVQVFHLPNLTDTLSSLGVMSYTALYFNDGSKEYSVPREMITFSSVESSGMGSSVPEPGQIALTVGCFVVVRGREAVAVPASPLPAGPIQTSDSHGANKGPRESEIAGIG